MPNIRINVGKPSRGRDHERHDDDLIAGWHPERLPKDEPRISSLTAGAGHDKWAQRAEKHSGPQFAPGVGTKKSSQ